MQREINIEIDRKEFARMLGLEAPVIDYDKIIAKTLRQITIPQPKNGLPGKSGEPGLDGSPDTGVEIINKINNVPLKGPKIDAQQLKNITQAIPLGGFNAPKLIAGSNVTVTKNSDGSFTIASTGGSGGTSVNGEIVSFSGTTGTLANTPTSAGIDLYRGGIWQQPAGGDYTLSGSTITLTTAASSGEVFAASYQF